jgi:hypothetical protein
MTIHHLHYPAGEGPPARVADGHARCFPADHWHCPQCGGPLAAFNTCQPCGLAVDFRVTAVPGEDIGRLLAARSEVEGRASTGQQLSAIQAFDALGVPPGGARMGVIRFLSGKPGLAKFRDLTREEAWDVLCKIDELNRWLTEAKEKAAQ